MRTICRLAIIFLASTTMTLSRYSIALAEVEKKVTVNQVVHATFLLRKSKMLSTLQKSFQKVSHKGSFFKGEIPEMKGIAKDLKKVKFYVQELPNGFLLVAQRDKLKIGVGVEFIDPLMGRIKVGGQSIQLRKGMSYLELAKAITPVILPPFLKKSKSRKTGFSNNPFNFLIPDAWGEGEGVFRYERPQNLPLPYEKLLDRFVDTTTRGGLIALTLASGAAGAVGTGTIAGAGAGSLAAAAATAGMMVSAGVAGTGVAVASLATGGIAGAGAYAGGLAVSAAGLASGATAAGLAVGAAAGIIAALGLTVGSLYLIDTVTLGLSKLDDLDRVGGISMTYWSHVLKVEKIIIKEIRSRRWPQ